MYIHFNGNPCGLSIGDCVIRAISIVTGMDRHRVYAGLCVFGYPCTIWGNNNKVWDDFLRSLGYSRHRITEHKTIEEFAEDHPRGRYIIGTGSHAVAVVDGNVIDSWDSSQQIPSYYYTKE